ncbi:MAG: YfiR family protein [Cytophagales bacterium]|nr:YfiR family protein [Cytophagales bacterium]
MSKKIYWTFLLLCLPAFGFGQLHKTQAAFIFNFALFINWPKEYQSSNFEISVLGNSEVLDELKTMTSDKLIGEQTVQVKKLNNLKNIGNPNILFIPNEQIFLMKEVLKATENKPCLIVTESDGYSKRGSDINFVLLNNKLKFELNQGVAEAKGLKLPDKLLKLAVLVSN